MLDKLLAGGPSFLNGPGAAPAPTSTSTAHAVLSGANTLNASGWTVATGGARAAGGGAAPLNLETLALMGGGLLLVALAWRALR